MRQFLLEIKRIRLKLSYGSATGTPARVGDSLWQICLQIMSTGELLLTLLLTMWLPLQTFTGTTWLSLQSPFWRAAGFLHGPAQRNSYHAFATEKAGTDEYADNSCS
jgi:hypothetical protein